MPSAKRARAAEMGESDSADMDMSSMIDMVFLLLIFFMVNSQIILIRQDPKVDIPTASKAKQPEDIRGRVVINIWKDGKPRDNTSASHILSPSEIETMMRKHKTRCDNLAITPYLHIRGDRDSKLADVKDVVKNAALGGVSNIIFGTYTVE